MSQVDLQIEGMTCTSCAARIERRLNKIDGVQASVNFATETARVSFPSNIGTAELVSEVEATGYKARVATSNSASSASTRDQSDEDPARALRDRLVIASALTIPVLLVSMIPALQFDNWQWFSLTLTAPVVVWGAWPFHQAAWTNLRHGAATMDTLISVGTTAAFGWSLYALFIGDAGDPSMRMGFDTSMASGSHDEIYLEVAAGVTVFIARVFTGPSLSPWGQLVTRVLTPLLNLNPKLVPGSPKRFAQGIGAVLSTTALVLHFGFGAAGPADIAVGAILIAASLESIFGFCLGCVLFAALQRIRVIPESTCEDCNAIWNRNRVPA